MTSARDILDQRLAKGEITTDDYDSLLAKLAHAKSDTAPASYPSAMTAANVAKATGFPKGSYFLGIGGIVVGIVWYSFASDIVSDIITDCVGRGNSFAFCQENAVKWPLVYVMGYIPAALVGVSGVIQLLLPKK